MLEDWRARLISVELRKIILVASQFFRVFAQPRSDSVFGWSLRHVSIPPNSDRQSGRCGSFPFEANGGIGKSSIPQPLIPGILSKIRPRNCPNQSYVRRITDSGHAPGVGG
jgi:hypothetical protein